MSGVHPPEDQFSPDPDPRPVAPHHVVPLRVYFAVFAALCVGTVLTVLAAGYDFGALNTPIALLIAVTKATLVVLYFMHVRYSSRLVTLILCAGLLFLGLLLLFPMTDYVSRPWPIVPVD
jgi:cytochrome c oxidase subunit IV